MAIRPNWSEAAETLRDRGELDGLWAVRVTYSVRLVLSPDNIRHEIILIDIGSHDEAYR